MSRFGMTRCVNEVFNLARSFLLKCACYPTLSTTEQWTMPHRIPASMNQSLKGLTQAIFPTTRLSHCELSLYFCFQF